MPYCEPHHSARARIIDFEVKKLELRRTSRPQPPRLGGELATIVSFPRARRAV
jgi:hypothetical protein